MAMRLPFRRPLDDATRQLPIVSGKHGSTHTAELVTIGYVGRHRAPESEQTAVPFTGNDDDTQRLPVFLLTAMAPL